VEGDRDGRVEEKRVGGVREAGEEGQEAVFPRRREAGEKWEIMQHCAIFCNRAKRWEPTNT